MKLENLFQVHSLTGELTQSLGLIPQVFLWDGLNTHIKSPHQRINKVSPSCTGYLQRQSESDLQHLLLG